MPASAKIIDLRNLLAEKFPHTPVTATASFKTGVPPLDSALPGGLPKGGITELISPHPSAGSASLLAALLQSAAHGRYFLALVDGRDSFDPGPLDNTCLRHLLWTRCRKATEAVKAADFLLRDGNFPIVIVDLVLNEARELNKIPQTYWYRLQRLVEPTSTACLVLSRRPMVGSAQIRVVLENQWTLANLEREDSISDLALRVQRSHVKQLVRAEAV